MMTSSDGNIFPITDPLRGESNSHRWISHTKGQWRGKWFHFMTSSCMRLRFNFTITVLYFIDHRIVISFITSGLNHQGGEWRIYASVIGTKPLPEPVPNYSQSQCSSRTNFMQDNVFETIFCKMGIDVLKRYRQQTINVHFLVACALFDGQTV